MDKVLSLIIPSYNMEKYLPKCLDSLIISDKNLLNLLEVLVINDGSTDKTSEIAHEFERRCPNVFRVIDKANAHYGSCVNRGVREADGFFVKILDADDSFNTDILEGYLRFLLPQAEHGVGEEIDMVLNDFVTVDPDDCEGRRHVLKYNTGARCPIEDLVASNGHYAMHAIAYRRKLLVDMAYHQLEGLPYTDTEWNLLPLLRVKNFTRFEGCLYRYLLGRDGQTVASNVWCLHLSDFVAVVKDIILKGKELIQTSSDSQRKVFDLGMVYVFSILYSSYLFDAPIDSCETELRAVDRIIRESSFNARDELKRLTLPSRHGFRYVDYWFNHVPSGRWYYQMIRSYLAVRKRIASWTKK